MQNEFVEYVTGDLLSDLDGVTSRAMFGGYGIYQDGVVFAMVVDERLYYKVGESSRAEYEAHGAKPFTYLHGKGAAAKPVAMSYWEVPEEILEDRAALREWTAKAIAASRAKKSAKKRGK